MSNALIVDDEIDIWFLLSSILRKHDLKSYFANSLAAATERLKEVAPAVLFLDNRLPDGLGINYIDFVRKNYPGVKIVLITGYDSPEVRKKACNAGADKFLLKPFTIQTITEVLDSLV